MRNAAVYVVFLGILACKESSTKPEPGYTPNCGVHAILDEELYQSLGRSYQVLSVDLRGNCLALEIGWSGCSEEIEPYLVDSELILESLPVQRSLRLSIGGNQSCDAYFTSRFHYDIHPLQLEEYDLILLNIDGWDESIRYEY